MWFFWLLTGFAPWSPDHAPSVAVPADAHLPTGAPAPHISRDRQLDVRLTQTRRWTSFTSKWGGSWAARWDPRTLSPRFLYAPGVPEADVVALVADVARLAGVDPTQLSEAKPVYRSDRTWYRWKRAWHGAPVEGDEVLVSVQQGRIGGVWVRLSPIGGLPLPVAGEVVRPLPTDKLDRQGNPAGIKAHLVRRTELDGVVTYTDRAGTVVHRYSTRHYDEVQVSHLKRTIGDSHVESPARQLTVEDTTGSTDTTLDDGSHSLSGDLWVMLDGPSLRIKRDGDEQDPVALTPDSSGVVVMQGDTDVSEATASVLHHFHEVFDWLRLRWPTHSWLGEKVFADVDISRSACNAYYTGGTINFFVGYGSSCYNFGEVADVIYHEVGHGIHHYILAGGTFAGDVSEGSADYVSATINNDPIVGLNSKPGGGIVRELETDKVYPDDVVHEVHADGLIWGSFLWNLRADWQALYGEEAGAEATDLLFLGALEQGPSLTDLYEAVVLADDDDGDLSNGTPHACDLVTLLDQHGLGPGPLGVVVMDHAPLGPQASDTAGYAIDFGVYSPTLACADYDPSSVKLWYTTGPLENIPGIDGDDSAAWDGWNEVALSADTETGTRFSGLIPRQLATTQVHYFMEARTTDGLEVLWSHGGIVGGVHSFRVGDLDEVWCEGFESGDPADWFHEAGLPGAPRGDLLDEWEVAEPLAGGVFVPEAAYSGAFVMGTNVSGNYSPNNQQYLQSELIPVPEGRMTLLTYQRWLTVEDGIYDHATASVDGIRYFENAATSDGVDHSLDVDWTLIELDMDDWRDVVAADGEVVLEWTLESDPGLEFGGWQLDDVCVVQLADIPAHYRRTELTAALDDDYRVTLTWENPWIDPLDRVMLVSADGDVLEDALVAESLLLLNGAAPGAANVYVDGLPLEPGTSRTYALIAAPTADDDFYSDLADGDNRVTVSRAPLPEDTGIEDDTGDDLDPDTDLPDDDSGVPPSSGSDDPDNESSKGSGCACSTPAGSPPAAWWLALAPLWVLGRRRR